MKTEARKCPDLQALVRACGGYDKITPEAWAQWDADCENYHHWLRNRDLIASHTEPKTSATPQRSHINSRRQQRRKTL
jgi:hypothetical protein